ncbi:MAG: hypothetical protein A2043_11615 [Candidatus Schekmanbacteria bacterium GWA2_38_9]|uniref:ABC transporter domain-containing protein n=1 Tax=Candidatus Schekmanbacteria bacterium RIFCSPLOWO2_12_FULL_38_15 TaxID=1817883 RepID=A0A1F7SH79_9BACT|nr:MAG: hypothetical protein A2043_11615 [Candidatus Schekmanbacteria bacterium GWA2_38_9]OGL48618.1 MAG: hypothetical protein A3H37_06020 [Candidatus Schekmanbacteria bacterium RIFCSPLOWO2_02_FULL_38_14]OGL52598.1 MAG: hypothetical protein A3G31_11580 [Candidatus Schekmanbacteria bacterium RIFCSPLOWO2_12_FULL_38_15]
MKQIELNNVSFSYGNGWVLENISFNVCKGDMAGILGPNGCGKTTLLRLIYKAIKPLEGNIRLFGKESIKRSEISKKIGVVPQRDISNIPFTVFEIVMMGRYPQTRGISFEKKEDVEIVNKIMVLLDISHFKEKYFNKLSGGERQRVLIARAIAQEPEILLLDEPTSHLDLKHQLECYRLLRKLNSERNLTVLIVSHDLNIASEYCNQLILFRNGAIHDKGTPDKVITNDNLKKVYEIDAFIDSNPFSSKPRITIIGNNKTLNKNT